MGTHLGRTVEGLNSPFDDIHAKAYHAEESVADDDVDGGLCGGSSPDVDEDEDPDPDADADSGTLEF